MTFGIIIINDKQLENIRGCYFPMQICFLSTFPFSQIKLQQQQQQQQQQQKQQLSF